MTTRNLLSLSVLIVAVITPAAQADVVDNYLANHPTQTASAPPDLVERWVLAHAERGTAARPALDLVERWVASHAQNRKR